MLVYIQTAGAPDRQDLFERIYMDYRDRMMAAAYALLKDRYDAEDAVHQSFLYIAENLDKFSHGDARKTGSYVIKLAESRAIDILRRKNRHSPQELDEERAGMPRQHPQLSELAACMARLPVRYRNALILRHAYGHTYAEVGELMDLSEDGARKLTAREKEKLEEICRKEGVL